MPQTKTQPGPAAKTQRRPAAKTQRRPAAKTQHRPAANKAAAEHDARSTVERTTELSEDVLKSLDDVGQNVIEAVRKFVETVDRVLPPRGDGPSRREEITDSALELAQRLVHVQSDFVRKVVEGAGKSLSRSGGGK